MDVTEEASPLKTQELPYNLRGPTLVFGYMGNKLIYNLFRPLFF